MERQGGKRSHLSGKDLGFPALALDPGYRLGYMRLERFAFDIAELLGFALLAPGIRVNFVNHNVACRSHTTKYGLHAREDLFDVGSLLVLGICSFSDLDIQVEGRYT